MRLLLDTALLLWLATAAPELSSPVREAVVDPLVPAIRAEYAIESLPLEEEAAHLATPDENIRRYSVPTIW